MTEDDTFRVLKRKCSFDELRKKVFRIHYGANLTEPNMSTITNSTIEENGWTVEDYRLEWNILQQRRFEREFGRANKQ